ncbi:MULTISPECIES: protein adenylyltransferase SelO [Hydrogenophaga]|uniref:Protein nucleotidyltransferase YdiU n=1 Tax=Hydrogenophaga intermedia TaxID=65786 RepID=A0A1L1PI27_HYDIT|nr:MULTISPECIES: YdiU family protein [Hydrogenophaga]AOS79144.1 hypothetical protein Q5W_09310 [Hydrogenophaga sp. PBC]TMU72496.1 YdiU family protein [Hydrogenophaga intermedia]CDN87419.1 hypothetical protein BN948_01841 [Hydrogenophaga intermedia]
MNDTDTAAPAALDLALPWRHRFADLGPAFFTELPPTPLPEPHLVSLNAPLAQALGLDPARLRQDDAVRAFSGSLPIEGARPLATVYSGHQFGVWAGQLGDGRALLLGELDTPAGPMEIQFKGAGRTPYSRMGDGRAVLRSSIREYLCSEAMHGLGIPTTRALIVTGSPQPVIRETVESASVVTRVAPSFIRFGHFEHFSANGLADELRRLADFVIDAFYPGCREAGGNPYARLLEAVSARTADLLAQWQAVGFCHGVMNTDNMSVLGLTIDYGPFQFLDAFNPAHICNHSDHGGRYAYHRQPNVAYWNLFCLGQALLPLMDDQQQALDALEPYKTRFPAALTQRMGAKLGLADTREGDAALIEELMQLMAKDAVDFTILFRRLCDALEGAAEPVRDLFLQRESFDAWAARWRERLQAQPGFDAAATAAAMRRVNPRIVLRNHLAQIAIQRAEQGDFGEVDRLLKALSAPYDERKGEDDLAAFPPDWAQQIEISCSS